MKIIILTIFYSSLIFGQFKIEDLRWMEGTWQGKMNDSTYMEEIISSPDAGTLIGMFRLNVKDQLKVLEFWIMRESGDSLIFNFRHFNPDLSLWEKDKAMMMVASKRDGNNYIFSGIEGAEVRSITLTNEDNKTMLSKIEIVNNGKTRFMNTKTEKVK